MVGDVGECRLVNNIIGLLLKEHLPGMDTLRGPNRVPEPSWTWAQYKATTTRENPIGNHLVVALLI